MYNNNKIAINSIHIQPETRDSSKTPNRSRKDRIAGQQLLSSLPANEHAEEYSQDERLLNEFVKMHPMLRYAESIHIGLSVR